MKRSEDIKELATALAKAQSSMAAAAKDSNNPFFKSKYADLASCWAAWRPAGPPNGLALMQFATAVEERLENPIQVQADDNRKAKTIHFVQRVSVETLLCHSSGQWVSEILTVLVKDDSPQSTILGETYCRRGGMCAVIGIAPEDDDGDSAANNGAESEERRTTPKPVCPNCSVNLHVIKGRQEYGGGWVCYKAKGGCGAKWGDDAAPEPPKEEHPQGTRTAKSDAKKKADELAAEHGLKTGEQILTEVEEKYFADAAQDIAKLAASDDKTGAEAALNTLSENFGDKSDALKKKLAPLWIAAMKVVNPKWVNPKKKETPQGAAA